MQRRDQSLPSPAGAKKSKKSVLLAVSLPPLQNPIRLFMLPNSPLPRMECPSPASCAECLLLSI